MVGEGEGLAVGGAGVTVANTSVGRGVLVVRPLAAGGWVIGMGDGVTIKPADVAACQVPQASPPIQASRKRPAIVPMI